MLAGLDFSHHVYTESSFTQTQALNIVLYGQVHNAGRSWFFPSCLQWVKFHTNTSSKHCSVWSGAQCWQVLIFPIMFTLSQVSHKHKQWTLLCMVRCTMLAGLDFSHHVYTEPSFTQTQAVNIVVYGQVHNAGRSWFFPSCIHWGQVSHKHKQWTLFCMVRCTMLAGLDFSHHVYTEPSFTQTQAVNIVVYGQVHNAGRSWFFPSCIHWAKFHTNTSSEHCSVWSDAQCWQVLIFPIMYTLSQVSHKHKQWTLFCMVRCTMLAGLDFSHHVYTEPSFTQTQAVNIVLYGQVHNAGRSWFFPSCIHLAKFHTNTSSEHCCVWSGAQCWQVLIFPIMFTLSQVSHKHKQWTLFCMIRCTMLAGLDFSHHVYNESSFTQTQAVNIVLYGQVHNAGRSWFFPSCIHWAKFHTNTSSEHCCVWSGAQCWQVLIFPIMYTLSQVSHKHKQWTLLCMIRSIMLAGLDFFHCGMTI